MNEDYPAVTLEDLHGEIFPEEAEELHLKNHCELYGFHRGTCPSKTYKDVKAEFEAELVINGN